METFRQLNNRYNNFEFGRGQRPTVPNIFAGLTEEFYIKIKNVEGVLSRNELYGKCYNSPFYSFTSIWKNSECLNRCFSNNNDTVIFGLRSGAFFTQDAIYFLDFDRNYGQSSKFRYFRDLYEPMLEFEGILLKKKYGNKDIIFKSNESDIKIIKDFFREIENRMQKYDFDNQNEENQKQEKLLGSIESFKTEFDRDKNGEIDLVDNDLMKLLSKNQEIIIDLDKNYIHQFIKVSNFIKTKKANIQKIFDSLEETQSEHELEVNIDFIKNQIHTYELLVFHSINMVGSIGNKDLITFYEIYEVFDKLGIYTSNWENEVSERLSNIDGKLNDLLQAIYDMESSVVNEISNLSYVTQQSFGNLQDSINHQLQEIDSTIKFGNLLSGIQTYQLYKMNKNTKSLNK